MSLTAAHLDALILSGCTAEQIVALVKADMAEQQARAARQIPWEKLRQMAFERDGHVCGYCGCQDGPFEIDHIIPRSKGGENVLENVKVACAPCNRAKRDKVGEDWEVLRDRRRKDRERKRADRAGKSKDKSGQCGLSANLSPLKVSPEPPSSNPPISPVVSSETTSPKDHPALVLDAWNLMAEEAGLPKARMTPERRKKLKTFTRRHRAEDITEAIWTIPGTPFLCGENERGWKANLDFLLQPKSFTKILEGSYGG